MGVPKTISAADLADPKVDHLTVMTYISQFRNVTPKLPKAQKCRLDSQMDKAMVGHKVY